MINILFYRYGSICEPDMINAFKTAGINVIEESEEITRKGLSDTERLKIVEKHLKEEELLFVFSINFYPVISNICHIYGVKYLGWTVDSPVPELFNKAILNDTNRIFMFDKAQFNMHGKHNPACAFHLPLAAACDRFDAVVNSITPEDIKRFSGDIAFVGSLYTEKDPIPNIKDLSDRALGYIEGLCESAMRVYGYNLTMDSISDDFLKEFKDTVKFVVPNAVDDPDLDRYAIAHSYLGYHIAAIERTRTLNTLAQFFNVYLYTRSDVSKLQGVNIRDGVRTLDEMPKVFNLAKINLNMTHRPIETGLPLRIFDIMGCGGFCMTNYQSEIEDMFEIGEEIETYSSIDELIDKCAYYLEHDNERAEIARRGYERVKAEHSYFHRMKEMLTVL